MDLQVTVGLLVLQKEDVLDGLDLLDHGGNIGILSVFDVTSDCIEVVGAFITDLVESVSKLITRVSIEFNKLFF